MLMFAPACITNGQGTPPARNIGQISLPAGYERVSLSAGSFGYWLRQVNLKKDNHVYLHNGRLKENQAVQYAVLDITVGEKDLQQCADAIMRLRAEYMLATGREDSISFQSTSGQTLRFKEWKQGTRYKLSGNRLIAFRQPSGNRSVRDELESYLEFVFTYCGTLSLERELKRSVQLSAVSVGDVLIKGGSPGHAMLVVDVATNKAGKRIFMLAQSYMPAQDIHIVQNPGNGTLSPWYEAADVTMIITPEWDFSVGQLRSW